MSEEKPKDDPAREPSVLWTVPEPVWSPLATGGLILVVGLLGLALDEPWLFPSLAPTAFLQVHSPKHPSSRPYSIVVGHLVGLGAGCLAVVLLEASRAPGVLASGDLTAVRLCAATLGLALAALGMVLARAPHPPAAATTLLIAEGSYKLNGEDVLLILIGVSLTAALGEGLRQVRLHYLPQPPDRGQVR